MQGMLSGGKQTFGSRSNPGHFERTKGMVNNQLIKQDRECRAMNTRHRLCNLISEDWGSLKAVEQDGDITEALF